MFWKGNTLPKLREEEEELSWKDFWLESLLEKKVWLLMSRDFVGAV